MKAVKASARPRSASRPGPKPGPGEAVKRGANAPIHCSSSRHDKKPTTAPLDPVTSGLGSFAPKVAICGRSQLGQVPTLQQNELQRRCV